MTGQHIGYIRVSGLDHNSQRQLEGVQLDRIFTDEASVRNTKRPQLDELLRFIQEGDILVVQSMDRLARNLDDLRSLVQPLPNSNAL
jgi:DNA invertase Pin-like site-specific DNA recombinase